MAPQNAAHIRAAAMVMNRYKVIFSLGAVGRRTFLAPLLVLAALAAAGTLALTLAALRCPLSGSDA
jgi:ABC-type siderophore export system fused ATPase/permease subunit